jgi:hypothetical protein
VLFTLWEPVNLLSHEIKNVGKITLKIPSSSLESPDTVSQILSYTPHLHYSISPACDTSFQVPLRFSYPCFFNLAVKEKRSSWGEEAQPLQYSLNHYWNSGVDVILLHSSHLLDTS